MKSYLKIFFLIGMMGSFSLFSQFIKGKILNDSQQVIKNVSIYYSSDKKYYASNNQGEFEILYKKSHTNYLVLSAEGHKTDTFDLPKINSAEEDIELEITLYRVSTHRIIDVKFSSKKEKDKSIVISIKPIAKNPSSTGDFNDIIKSLQGVMSANELSSQYNVRGGSFDENLVYVNSFEIYRPQLIRSGQQEGMSFINPDLVSKINFSAGGFESQYGDKLSSVLDVQYRIPKSNSVGVQLGTINSSFFVEGVIFKNDSIRKRKVPVFTYSIGSRYRSNKNVLNTLDAIGLYKSIFSDLQAFLTYRTGFFSHLELITNISQNRFRFEPEFQETSFGTIQKALKLRIGFEGQEIMDYNSAMTGLAYVFNNKITELKFMASAFTSNEKEHYDVQGAYQIYELDNNFGSDNFGNTRSLLGYGYFINHARNDLFFRVVNLSHQGVHKFRDSLGKSKHNKLLWGLKYQNEFIEDYFKEWKYNDSSGYQINPFSSSGTSIFLNDYIRSNTLINNQRWSGFIQYHQNIGKVKDLTIIGGVRAIHSSLNDELNISPRFQAFYEPNKKYNSTQKNDSLKKQFWLIKAAYGHYYQPPFYREMRRFNGTINTNLKSQKSTHYVLGTEKEFKRWGRIFKWSSDLYYKQLEYMVPYVLDNVRIRYYGENSSTGYAAGMDFRINGEFIDGLESWFSLSLLKTDEQIKYFKDGQEITSPMLRRPTDRRVFASIMFQDELPRNPSYQLHLMLFFGTAVPYYLGGDARYKKPNTIDPYKRVDLGFSRILIDENNKNKKITKYNKHFKSLWFGLDVLNLLDVDNVVSYILVKDFDNNTFGVPSYLTGRRLNARLTAKF